MKNTRPFGGDEISSVSRGAQTKTRSISMDANLPGSLVFIVRDFKNSMLLLIVAVESSKLILL